MPTPTQEWLCQQIVEGTHDAIIVADREGVIRLWNTGAEEIFGYMAGEAIGQKLDLIIPERLRQRHWEGYHKTMATGVTSYGRTLLAVPAVRKDGARISLEFSIALVHDEAGTLFGTAAVIRDVTARWEQEKVLKQQIAALSKEGATPKASP
jgi:PAS domain S-box-containing protein